MRVAIHQPQYWPWPPYLHKVLSADVFVFLDTVQYSKNGLQNRNQIKTAQGASWLTVPVRASLSALIRETRISDGKALARHWKTIAQNYSKTPGFEQWGEEIRSLLERPHETIDQASMATVEWMAGKLGFGKKMIPAGQVCESTAGGSQLVAEICRALGATEYLTGTGALAYMDRDHFRAIGCRVLVQEWNSPTYAQAHPKAGFVPDLSALDLLLNNPDTAGEIIREAGRWRMMWDL